MLDASKEMERIRLQIFAQLLNAIEILEENINLNYIIPWNNIQQVKRISTQVPPLLIIFVKI